MIPDIIDYRPVYASSNLTISDANVLHVAMEVNTAVSGDLTAVFTSPPWDEQLTTVANGTGF